MFNEVVFNVVPERTGKINRIMIQDKLEQLDTPVASLSLGTFDFIGEITAKKQRTPDSELFHKVGAFFRPNYERGLLIYALIKKFNLQSYLEIGYGRGYSCFCAALAFSELGNGGKATTIDPNLKEEQVQTLSQVFPAEWFQSIEFRAQTSDQYFASLDDDKFDLIYIDGDHRYEQVQKDWKNTKDRFGTFLLFDDYHMPGNVKKDMEVSAVVDAIDDYHKELIIGDRRIFVDDRGYTDDQIDYGQVLVSR